MRRALARDVTRATLASLPILVVFVGLLPVVLAAAHQLALTPSQTTGWIIAVYGVPGAITLAFGLRFRQPILFTANLSIIVFVASLARTLGYADMLGGTVVAGTAYALLGLLGLPRRFAGLVPISVVRGILAGISLPFVIHMFDALGRAPLMVGATVSGFVVARALRVSSGAAVLAAFLTGLVVAAVRGDVTAGTPHAALLAPALNLPHITLAGAVTVAPVAIVFIALANVPSTVYLRERGFRSPDRTVDVASGVGTVLGSLLGPTGVCVPFLLAPLAADDGVGRKHRRYLTAMIAALWLLLFAAFAGAAVATVASIPVALLTSLAGLALLDVLVDAVRGIGRGGLRLAPVVAFAAASSQLAWLGLGPLFWAVTLGTATARLLERRALAERTP